MRKQGEKSECSWPPLSSLYRMLTQVLAYQETLHNIRVNTPTVDERWSSS
ncbi:hypothetical protein T02_9029 [Trichinella nativa]|uniref:Uncharacterized protein n=1 Tax=Trichinella nativa TaxID=6335 RepID=A0A0V1KGR5_9BILA|nr:hypothetical protein T02_9029 [Trichinella nativa]